jgi:SAM-dependent methyltransferase
LTVLREQADPVAPPPADHRFWLGNRAQRRREWDASWSREILEGHLACTCGADYAITRGIPRFLDNYAAARSDQRGAFSRTGECYTYLWRFKAERIGWQHKGDEESSLFLRSMDVSESDLPGKALLDAGCGDGRFTSSLAELGMETVGVDLSEGVDIGYAQNRSPLVHYVQGDLLKPPLRKASFDYVWSFGVLHHTRDTRRAFRECAERVRADGRLFVWLYDKAPARRGSVIEAVQKAPMPVKRFVSQVFALGNRVKRAVGRGNPVTRQQSADEVYFWNLDMYGPEFRHLVPLREAQRWFGELGFDNINPRDRMEFGYGITGDLPRMRAAVGAEDSRELTEPAQQASRQPEGISQL